MRTSKGEADGDFGQRGSDVLPLMPEVEKLQERLAVAIEESRLTRDHSAFVIVSIDHMDVINIAHGFETGDFVLAGAAAELHKVVRQMDYIGRLSGSKFGIVLTQCDHEKMLIACKRFRNRLRNHVFKTDAGPVAVTVSIGCVVMPENATSPREAIGNAMMALEEARRDRVQSVAVYRRDWQRDQRRKEDARAAQNTVSAIAENRLRFAFQPVVDAASGKTVFHEALIRIQAHDGSLVDASSFIAAAERLGIIRMVDMTALRLALDELAKAPEAVLSVNVSNDAAHDPAWLRELASRVEKQPELASRLIIEITESQATLDIDNTRALVEAIRRFGCRIAIDDFGAGYTSFRNLKELPVDIIKIDGEFAQDLPGNPANQVFVRALVDIAHALHAKTVVEWVTDEETAALLRGWGVDYLQGFVVASPLAVPPWRSDVPPAQSDGPA